MLSNKAKEVSIEIFNNIYGNTEKIESTFISITEKLIVKITNKS